MKTLESKKIEQKVRIDLLIDQLRTKASYLDNFFSKKDVSYFKEIQKLIPDLTNCEIRANLKEIDELCRRVKSEVYKL